LVGRGDEVEIKLISGALEMDAKGKALAAGSLGETIEVEMLGSKKRIKSLVLSTGKVEVKL
jgi:flagella basal body P-ring formation protein FlgA